MAWVLLLASFPLGSCSSEDDSAVGTTEETPTPNSGGVNSGNGSAGGASGGALNSGEGSMAGTANGGTTNTNGNNANGGTTNTNGNNANGGTTNPTGGTANANGGTVNTPEGTGPSPIEPGALQIVTGNLVFGARFCTGDDDLIYYPNRLGYPNNGGLEELWSVSKLGAEALYVATPGSATGCAYWKGELWVAANNGNEVFRVNASSGAVLPPYITPQGIPIQVATNGSAVFASVIKPGEGGGVIAIDPTLTADAQTLWSKSGNVPVTWLKTSGDKLLFTANDLQNYASWVVSVNTKTLAATEWAAGTGDLGGVDAAGDTVFYADHEAGAVRQLSLTSGADTLFTSLDQVWSVLVDGDYLYLTARPDYCENREGKVFRVPLAGGAPVLLADQQECPAQLSADARGLYWINSGSWSGPDIGADAPPDGSVIFLPR